MEILAGANWCVGANWQVLASNLRFSIVGQLKQMKRARPVPFWRSTFVLNNCRLIGIAFLAMSFAAIPVFGQTTTHSDLKRPIDLWRQVEVIRTGHGVPHIRAKNLRAAGFALAWLQCEDYGTRTPMEILAASGRRASIEGSTQIESDFAYLRKRIGAEVSYRRLSRDVRDVYEGFAAGLVRYIEMYPEKFPKGMPTGLSGLDVAVAEMPSVPTRKLNAFLSRLGVSSPSLVSLNENDESAALDDNDGSNAWAFSPERTRSGKAILLRNPHLSWTAGYYEAHITVPGILDFYGDFRIGSPFAVVGGFNRDLGWSTTNNSPDLDTIYSLDADPKSEDRYIFDGRSVPLRREVLAVAVKNGDAISNVSREFWFTSIGPVFYRTKDKIYVIRYAGDGEIRGGEQFLKMMRARTLAEWKTAMKMRARVTSNFTYADRAGNIYFIWNASLPLLPHYPIDERSAIPAHGAKDVWSQYVPFDSLPQVLNPPGGYVQNENNSPHFTNVRKPIDLTNAYPNFEAPTLSLRAQLAIQLVNGDQKFSLEDVVKLKHSYRMLLADRVKPDLIAAIKASDPKGDTASGLDLIENWDNTSSPDSRGSVLFDLWWQNYSFRQPDSPNSEGRSQTAVGSRYPESRRFAQVWSSIDPLNTPRGLADLPRAVRSFTWAVEEAKHLYGSFNVTWGEVHRVRRGPVDVPVGGCGNDLGCFRVLGFARDADGKFSANSGDGWILAVEFDRTPRAVSVLAYGESRLKDSPWFSDQAEMFAAGELKKVAFLRRDIDAQAVKRYHPGEKRSQ